VRYGTERRYCQQDVLGKFPRTNLYKSFTQTELLIVGPLHHSNDWESVKLLINQLANQPVKKLSDQLMNQKSINKLINQPKVITDNNVQEKPR